MKRLFVISLLASLAFFTELFPQAVKSGENKMVLRGQEQIILFFPAAAISKRPGQIVLYVPGDRGMKGVAVTMAQTIASFGYDVFGLDTRHYLSSFTGKTTLKETEVMSDFRRIAEWMSPESKRPVALVGWSEGAGLCLLAASAAENKRTFSGLITLGLPESNVLGWRLVDMLTYLTKKDPDEPSFKSIDYLAGVSPLPLVMIQSSQDDWVSLEAARKMFVVAGEPKRFISIEARNHHFDGNTEEFYRSMRESLQWIEEMSR